MKELVARMSWLNEPDWGWEGEGLVVMTRAGTDCWQRTHYGFQRDNAHALVLPVAGRWSLRGRFEFEPNAQYDQCGLYVRADAECWFKCSMEYEPGRASHLGSVVTHAGYSDWATQEIASEVRSLIYEVVVDHLDLVARYSSDGVVFHQLRVAHLAAQGPLVAGIYGCSPTGSGFRFRVSELKLMDGSAES